MKFIHFYESLAPNEQWCVIVIALVCLLAFMSAINEERICFICLPFSKDPAKDWATRTEPILCPACEAGDHDSAGSRLCEADYKCSCACHAGRTTKELGKLA